MKTVTEKLWIHYV